MSHPRDDELDQAWEAAKPKPGWRDRHGRPELRVHPFLLKDASPLPRTASAAGRGSEGTTATTPQ